MDLGAHKPEKGTCNKEQIRNVFPVEGLLQVMMILIDDYDEVTAEHEEPAHM